MMREDKTSKRETKKAFKKTRYDSSAKNNKVKIISKDEKRKGFSDAQKSIFILSLDPYEKTLKWWESDHIKYAINYKPIKLRVETLMGSQVVRLTDRKYMMLLMENIRNDHRDKQLIRIEEKKEWVKSTFGLHYTSSDTPKC